MPKSTMAFAPHKGVRTATNSDVKAIVDLVNRAFSVERFFVTGDRTDETQVRELLQSGLFLLHSDGSTLTSLGLRQAQPRSLLHWFISGRSPKTKVWYWRPHDARSRSFWPPRRTQLR